MKKFNWNKSQTLLLSLAVFLLTACQAEYGYKQGDALKPFATQGENLPQGDGGTDGDGGKDDGKDDPKDHGQCPRKCQNQVLVHVQQIRIKDCDGKSVVIPSNQGFVDLCELSQDFLGGLKKELNAKFKKDEHVGQVDLILSGSDGHRVENNKGAKLCDLRVPSGATAGIRFIPKKGSTIKESSFVKYVFNDQDALHQTGNASCQLKHPTGNYELILVK